MMLEESSASPRHSPRLVDKHKSPKSTSSEDGSLKDNSLLLELSSNSCTPKSNNSKELFETPSTHPKCVLISRGNILHSGLDSEGESPKSPTSTPPRSNVRRCPAYSPKCSPSSSPRWHRRFRKALAEVAWEESNRTRFEAVSFYGRKAESKSSFELKMAAAQLGLPAKSRPLPLISQSEKKVKKTSRERATSRSAMKRKPIGTQSSKKVRPNSIKKLVPAKKPTNPAKSIVVEKSVNQKENESTSDSTITTRSPPRTKRKFFSVSSAQRSPSKRPRASFKMGNHKVSVEASRYSPKRRCYVPYKSPSPSSQQLRTSPRRHNKQSQRSSPRSDACLAPQNLDFTRDFETTVNASDAELQGMGLFEDPPAEEMEADKTGKNCSPASTTVKENQLYPIFSRSRSGSTPSPPNKTIVATPRKLLTKFSTPRRGRPRTSKKDGLEQLVIDVGQKEVAAFCCDTCGMYYTPCDEEDNITHTRYHNILQTNLKFPGWKKEKVVAEFHDGRIIHIVPSGPRYAQQKMLEVREVVDEELGFAESVAHKGKKYQAFLFISEKKVVGCVLAETISSAHRLIDDTSNPSLCCKETSEKALCGVSRIWTLKTQRKQKVATRLMDSLRSHFIFGYVLSKEEIAFSVPTQDGQKFAANYTGTTSFLVYK